MSRYFAKLEAIAGTILLLCLSTNSFASGLYGNVGYRHHPIQIAIGHRGHSNQFGHGYNRYRHANNIGRRGHANQFGHGYNRYQHANKIGHRGHAYNYGLRNHHYNKHSYKRGHNYRH